MHFIISDMASKTVTPKSESNEQDNKSKSSQEMSNKPETIPLKSPSVIEEIINDKNSPIIERHLTGIYFGCCFILC